MAAIVNTVREEVAVATRRSAGGVATNSTITSACTLVGTGQALAATETTIMQTKSGPAAGAIAEAIGSGPTSRQLLSNAVQQGVEDALLDRLEKVN